MDFSVKTRILSKDSARLEKISKRLIRESEVIGETISALSDTDESYNRVCRSLRKTGTELEKRIDIICKIEEALIEISAVYGQTEKEICTFKMFEVIPDDKKYELESDLAKKMVVDDTNHKVEFINPIYFKKNIQDNVDSISTESVIMDGINAFYLTLINDPSSEEAQIEFTVNSQIKGEDYMLGLMDGAILGKILGTLAGELADSGIIESDSLDKVVDYLQDHKLLTPEYLAYGILIDGVPMVEYIKAHPEEFYNDTTLLAQRDRNKARKEEKRSKKQQKIA